MTDFSSPHSRRLCAMFCVPAKDCPLAYLFYTLFQLANNKMHDLQAELDETLDISRRYRRLYRDEKEHNQTLPVNVQHPQSRGSQRAASARHIRSQPVKDDGTGDSGANPHERLARVAEDDRDDDEACVKRHVARIRESKPVRSCTIRVEDIIRKNEVSKSVRR